MVNNSSSITNQKLQHVYSNILIITVGPEKRVIQKNAVSIDCLMPFRSISICICIIL